MIDFGIDYFDPVGAILAPKFRQLGRQWRHLGPQDPPRSPKMSCGNRPFSCLGAKRPAGPPQDLSKRSQDSPKTPPKRDPRRLKSSKMDPQLDTPKKPQAGSKRHQEAPKTSPRRRKMAPSRHQDVPRRPKQSHIEPDLI